MHLACHCTLVETLGGHTLIVMTPDFRLAVYGSLAPGKANHCFLAAMVRGSTRLLLRHEQHLADRLARLECRVRLRRLCEGNSTIDVHVQPAFGDPA